MKKLRFLYNPLILLSIFSVCCIVKFFADDYEKGGEAFGYAMVVDGFILFLVLLPSLLMNWLINFFVKYGDVALVLKFITALVIVGVFYMLVIAE